uniref:EGF-like domain-containing protein n=1 Tax=Panagrellus redivivus TaxID=6233 RepID=A0A7E4VBF5_PANRE
MRFFLLFLLFLGAFADEVSLLDHLNTSKFLQNEKCPPLFYGSDCQIPHCFTEHGSLVRELDDYYCKCPSRYSSGKHCENIDCNYGKLSNSTFTCDCPFYASRPYCELTSLICLTLWGLLILFLTAVRLLSKNEEESPATSTNRTPQNQTRSNAPQPPVAPAPAPEIRIVERVVIQERSDAPPTYYDSAIDPANPPKYTV